MGPAVLAIRSPIIQEGKPSRPSTPRILNERLAAIGMNIVESANWGGFFDATVSNLAQLFAVTQLKLENGRCRIVPARMGPRGQHGHAYAIDPVLLFRLPFAS